MSATVLVTGHGGFLGRAICKELLANGYEVRGLARNRYLDLEQLGVKSLQASAVDEGACEEASRGVDAVIHTAALAGVWGPAKQFELANVVATDNLLRSSTRNGVRAFVFTSSPSVTFDGKPQRNIDESVPYPSDWLCHYPRTKAIAEKHVLEANQFGTFSTCALRPHLIWGKGDPHLVPRVIDRCRKGKLRCVGDGKNLIDTVHVDYAAIAHRLALERMLEHDKNAAGRSYFITDGSPIGCWEWITNILESAGLKPPSKRITFLTAYRIGTILELVYRLAGSKKEPPMTRFVAAQLGVDHFFDISAARTILGYEPMQNRQEHLARLR